MGKGQIGLEFTISVLVIFAIFIGTIWLAPQIVDISDIEGAEGTTGSLEIDEDNLDAINENLEDLGTKLDERLNYDWVIFILFGIFLLALTLMVLGGVQRYKEATS